jgi:hypothetical protein
MRTRVTIAALAVVILLLVGATGAVAYWTATGGGSGSATTTVGSPVVSFTPSSAITGVDPGASPQTLSGTIVNAGASGYVTRVSVSVYSVAKAIGAPAGSCDPSDYSITQAPDVRREIARNSSYSWTGATIGFTSTIGNQDACKGATITLSYTVR